MQAPFSTRIIPAGEDSSTTQANAALAQANFERAYEMKQKCDKIMLAAAQTLGCAIGNGAGIANGIRRVQCAEKQLEQMKEQVRLYELKMPAWRSHSKNLQEIVTYYTPISNFLQDEHRRLMNVDNSRAQIARREHVEMRRHFEQGRPRSVVVRVPINPNARTERVRSVAPATVAPAVAVVPSRTTIQVPSRIPRPSIQSTEVEQDPLSDYQDECDSREPSILTNAETDFLNQITHQMATVQVSS